MDRCVNCGIATSQCTTLGRRTLHDEKILSVIRQWLAPQSIQASSHICHTCWVAADRAAGRVVSGPSTSSQQETQPLPQDLPTMPPNKGTRTNQPEPTIVLPGYMRAVETERRCFIEGCKRPERNRVPLPTRKMLLNQYKYYIPENNRLCDRHLFFEVSEFIDRLRSNSVQFFTAKQVQDMMSL